MGKLDGKWALITGSSRGIGRQIALGLAREGCAIILHGREMDHLETTAKLVREYGVDIHRVAGELGTPDGIASTVDGVGKGPGKVDILYNNAAIMNAWKPIWDISMDEWHATLRVNVYGPIALCNAFAPTMRDRGYGRIINLSSGINGIPQLSPYSISKAALDKYTRDLAAELNGTNVLVSSLDPGWLRTDLGGDRAPNTVESVLPGALVPALLPDGGANGGYYEAQKYR